MKFVKLFSILKGDSAHEDSFIELGEFVKFIRDRDPNQRPFNIKRAFQTKSLHNKEVISVSSVLKYCYQHSDSLKSCRCITKCVENEILNSKETLLPVESSYELYKQLSQEKILENESVLSDIKFDDQCIDTLIVDHKKHFTDKEWQKICWFETHFSKLCDDDWSKIEFNEIVRQKHEEFQNILAARKLSDVWLQVSKKHIKNQLNRLALTNELQKFEIYAHAKHCATVLESHVLRIFEKYTEDIVTNVLCFDTDSSKLENTIQVVAVLSVCEIDTDLFYDICKRTFYSVKGKHNLFIEYIYVYHFDSVSSFLSEEVQSRFLLRDEILVGDVKGCLLQWNYYHVKDELQSFNECATNTCVTCFDEPKFKPLSACNFNSLTEWFLSTPIETQVLFEVFINKSSFKKTKNEEFFQKKVERLYRIYDTLLNTFNRNFIGVHQQAYTDELLIEYKSVSSVFNVTSAAGATRSLTGAETNIKKKANTELCYYNTYLKRHDLIYTDCFGEKKINCSLRDCHVILMLDNLVRLKYVADPDPGECRSKQLCTLPITLQGLPLDSNITSEWHSSDCDGSYSCLCKEPVQLNSTDINDTLLHLQYEEKIAYERFFQLMTFGNKQLWSKLTDEILLHLDDQHGKQDQGRANIQTTITESCERSESSRHDSEEAETEEDVDLQKLLQVHPLPDVEEYCDLLDANLDSIEAISSAVDQDDEESFSISEVEKSIQNMSISESETLETENESIQSLLSSFGFNKFKVPTLLCRHPPPAIGRDDDLNKIKDILDDILLKLGYITEPSKSVNRILCGPDNKIGKSLFQLYEKNNKYKAFLVEFPLLHLRKSMITILCSGYKDAGLIQLIQFMRDDYTEEWQKLVSLQHINTATKVIKRLAVSLHLAFLIAFAKYLDSDQRSSFLTDMDSLQSSQCSEIWEKGFQLFLDIGSQQNATFALHVDIMKHCDDVIAVALAERLGGPEGYTLLLAAVKQSVRFSFINNASSYAPYCIRLLYHHYSSGYFHQSLKKTLYSTPFRSSSVNYACDTKREIDHLEAIKGFRSGSNISSVTCRMSLIDSLQEIRDGRQRSNEEEELLEIDSLGWETSASDAKHILPTVELMLRQGALSTEQCDSPMNVYTKTPLCLSRSILDALSDDTAEFLIKRFIVKEKLYNMTEVDMPALSNINGPPELIQRAKKSKGITIKRTIKSSVKAIQTERQTKEFQRQKELIKEAKKIDCLTSENNACQAILKPDSSKPKVMKAMGMQRALKSVLLTNISKINTSIKIDNLMSLNSEQIPQQFLKNMKVCVVEFAGVKFKTGAIKSGKEYLNYVDAILKDLIYCSKHLETLVICEEKYSYTPDDLKAGTRDQRKSKTKSSVDHLKLSSNLINENVFNKDALTKTQTGKQAISLFLAQNLASIDAGKDQDLIVDSELYQSECLCSDISICSCEKYSTPITKLPSHTTVTKVNDVRQKKGEAEMAIIDWLVHFQCKLQVEDCTTSIITSGDIDAVYIHLFAISKFRTRNSNGKFLNQVNVILQKPKGKSDIYNITAILELLEEAYCDRLIGQKLALALCLGGNDFFPKCYGISHETVQNIIIEQQYFRDNLFTFGNSIRVNIEILKKFYQTLFCPKRYINCNLPFETVRALTIGKKTHDNDDKSFSTNDPRKWLPPETVIEKLGELFQLQINYLETAGNHEASLPNFLESSCIVKSSAGEVDYNFGPEAHFERVSDLPECYQPSKAKRPTESTPQKGARKKRQLTSTPRKT